MAAGGHAFGRPIERNEDERLLRGAGRFIDDVEVPNVLHAAFLRSTVAHARIRGVNANAARALPGVVAVYTSADVEAVNGPAPCLFRQHAEPDPRYVLKSMPSPQTQRPLATDEVFFVGQTVAMVVAENRAVAEDAAELIEVDYEELPVVVDLDAAIAPGSPRVHAGAPNNIAGQITQRVGDPERAFREAAVVLRKRYVLERSAAMPMETRGVVASFDRRTGSLTVWDNTQVPIPLKRTLAWLLSIPEEHVRVIATESGGGFGVKAVFPYPEELLTCWAAVQLGQPVKWIEDRREHFIGSNHERKQIHELEIAATRDGVVLGLRDHFLHDTGAFIQYGLTTPIVSASQIAGPYRIPNIFVDLRAVHTNTVPTSPYRGAGRPHACFTLERALDHLADELGIARAEIRQRNLIRPAEFPYRRDGLHSVDTTPVVMDSGNYHEQLQRLLDAIGYASFPEEQRRAREQGRHIGLGLAFYVESTGVGPYEGAHVKVLPASGKVHVAAALTSQGQGHETTFAQIAAEQLGVDPHDVVVVEGDTDIFPWGVGTYASRAAVNTGMAILRAAQDVREKACRLAGNMLEVAPHDLELKDGKVMVRGAPERFLTLRQVATAANPDRYAFDPEIAQLAEFLPPRPADGPLLPRGDSPGLEASGYFSAECGPTWASGAHAAVVEVDVQTGLVRYLRYVAVHDCGTLINPLIVDGQVMGGIAQGIGGALYERLDYDAAGQLRNASFMDFLLPSATEAPPTELLHTETPSPLNELGVKGAGEGGAIPGPALTAAAIENALQPLAVQIAQMPIDPPGLVELIAKAERARGETR
ncbi:MAG: molybdopterin cofactor-binding domain-containing protein [Candidatus Binatia bacterium]